MGVLWREGEASMLRLTPFTQKRNNVPRFTISDLAPFLRSNDGYICTLEGLTASNGAPVVYVHGLPFGSPDEVVGQIMYSHERCQAQCAGGPLRAPLTIVNVRANSFRFPDNGCLRAMRLTQRLYPWIAGGSDARTVFLAAPGVVRWAFQRVRPLMSAEQFSAITFADELSDLSPCLLPTTSVPAFLGGAADWTRDRYISERCAAEGVDDTGGIRHFDGTPIDWALLDRFDEKQKARASRRQLARTQEATASLQSVEHSALAEERTEMRDSDEAGNLRSERRSERRKRSWSWRYLLFRERDGTTRLPTLRE